MKKLVVKENYSSKLDIYQTQVAIKLIKDYFEKELAKSLNLIRVSAPLFVKKSSGLNDNLNGYERPVNFDIKDLKDEVEVVQSLAKWKRYALAKYDIHVHKGIYADMNAIRRDEELDNLHSAYVDQWDWEKSILKEDRTLVYLFNEVNKIYEVIKSTERLISEKYEGFAAILPQNITFISTSELENMYPNLTRKEREDEIVRKYKAVFLYKIGWPLKDNKPHDGRASDYDDWNLNGDILLYYDVLDCAFEISSMGIRVDENSLIKQINYKNETDKLNNPYVKAILNHKLPYSIGGGIGQSRLCMYFLKKIHIGEVQTSLWDDEEIEYLKKFNINLL